MIYGKDHLKGLSLSLRAGIMALSEAVDSRDALKRDPHFRMTAEDKEEVKNHIAIIVELAKKI